MKKLILFVIILICLIPMFTQAEEKLSQDEILSTLLKTLGGDYVEGDLSANGLLLDKYLEVEDLEDLGEDIKESIGLIGIETDINSDILDEHYHIKETIDDDGYSQINYFGFDQYNNYLTVILSSYLNEEGTKGETYLYINLIKNEQFIQNNDIINKIETIFKGFNQPVEFTNCIIGSFDGKFNEEEIEKKGLYGIHKIKGKIVDVYKDEYIISYTAYSEYIDNSILAGEEMINLNIALRYNEYDNKTFIWVGTPIIASGY